MTQVLDTFIGHSSQILDVLDSISQIADTDATVLLEGETGTGKEMVARAIHKNSKRSQHPLVCVNCGAIPNDLLESEFFGYEKGAFTGASRDHKGKFEQANQGTIFLDEIDDMSYNLQVKLLRILQWGEFSPLGSECSKNCNVRIVAASKQPLQKLIATGKFRDDLYYRLNLIRLQLPPLRERKNDILPLANYFLAAACREFHKPALTLSAAVEAALQDYHYPGNVRELENIIRRMVIFCNGTEIQKSLLPPEINLSPYNHTNGIEYPGSFHIEKQKVIENFEIRYLKQVLAECHGIIRQAATRAGIQEKNFHLKLKKYGIRPERS